MSHTCRYLCSEIVQAIFEPKPGEICQTTANLEEISATSAVVLMEERPRLGAPISLSIQDYDVFGVITSSDHHPALGWFATIALEPESSWNEQQVSPKHLLSICSCAGEDVTQTKAKTLEVLRNTEEIVPVKSVARGA